MNREENESLTVKLISKIDQVPDITLTEDDVKIIGRNPEAKIKNIKCPRKLYQVELRAEESNWFIFLTNLKTNETGLLKDGHTIKGPGFEYNVVFEKSKFSGESADNSLVKKLNDEDSEVDCSPAKKSKFEVSPIKKMASEAASYWEEVDDGSVQIFHFQGGGSPSAKIAAFDYDGTLVTVKSGAKFPKDGSDWKLFDRSIPELIRKYCNGSEDSHRFVIFSNQKGVSTGHTPFEHVKQRIESTLKVINIPCTAFLALRDNIYRKPRPGMMFLLQNCYNDLTPIDTDESFYVGDAAGRKTPLNKDHSCADLLFAINTGLPFLTPEQFRVGKRPKKAGDISTTLHNLPFFNPRALRDNKAPFAVIIESDGSESSKLENINQVFDKINSTISGSHCIIFIGLPGVGKSTFYEENLKKAGYARICRDELGTMDKCEREFERLVKAGGSNKSVKIVIDNINVDDSSRSQWINICQNSGLTPIAFHFNIGREHAIHNNTYRRLLNQMCKDSTSPPVPDWIISKHAKSFVPPSYKEGFKLIFKLNFSPNFGDRSDREIELYYMYLNDK